jgi:hypothetical protein
MAIDYAESYSSLYTTGAGNAGVLALLGGASSVFPREQLGNTSGKVLPWLVWSHEAVAGERGEMSDLHAAWWAYIAPNGSIRTLYDIAAALDTAYLSIFSITGGRIVMGKPGKPFVDTALNNLQGLRIPLRYRALG